MTGKEAAEMISDFAAQSDKYGVISEELFEAFQMAVTALENSNECKKCEWYDEFKGVCINGNSPFCADTVMYPEIGCGCFKTRKQREKTETDKWEINGPRSFETYRCPFCGNAFDNPFPHCPTCGEKIN